MSMFTAFNVSASGMTAQQLRTDVISENIANADTTRTKDGTPYVRKAVVFTEKTMTGTAIGKPAYGSYGTGAYSTFSDALRLANGGVVGSGVKVTSVYEDTSTDMERVYDPSHPDADENGYVTYPNVNIVQEMTDLIDASRSYEANISAFNASKSMATKGLSIGSTT
ncbi:MAG: flagellar basal body rod protein FlgC [Lachnospira sp.]|nr:flagellar basal body rod protein FlgC [Lachnospira sp.]